MFDIGFWELSLIAVIALLILGPERLPRAARQAGLWAGKMRRMVNDVRSNINEELRMEELNALKQAGQDLKNNLKSAGEEIGSVEKEMRRSAEDASKQVQGADIKSAIAESAPAASAPPPPSTSTPATEQTQPPAPAAATVTAPPSAPSPAPTAAGKAAAAAPKAKAEKKGKKPKKPEKKGKKPGKGAA